MKRMWVDACVDGTNRPKIRLYGWVAPLPKYPDFVFVIAKEPESGRYRCYETTCGATLGAQFTTLRETVAEVIKLAEGHSQEEIRNAVRARILERAKYILGE